VKPLIKAEQSRTRRWIWAAVRTATGGGLNVGWRPLTTLPIWLVECRLSRSF